MSPDRPLQLGDRNPHGEEAHRSENRIFWLLILANVAVLVFIGLLWGARVATDIPAPGTEEFRAYREQIESRIEGATSLEAVSVSEFNRQWKTSQIDPGRDVFAVEGRWFALTAVGDGWRLVIMARGGHRLDCWFSGEQLPDLRAAEGDERVVVRGVAAGFEGREGLHFCRVSSR